MALLFVSAVMMPWTLSMTTSGTSPSWSTSLVSFYCWFMRPHEHSTVTWMFDFFSCVFRFLFYSENYLFFFFVVLLWLQSDIHHKRGETEKRQIAVSSFFLIKRVFSYTMKQFLISIYFVIRTLSITVGILILKNDKHPADLACIIHWIILVKSDTLPSACLFCRWKRSDKQSWTPVTRRKFCNWLRRKERRDFCRPWPNFIFRTQQNNNNQKENK